MDYLHRVLYKNNYPDWIIKESKKKESNFCHKSRYWLRSQDYLIELIQNHYVNAVYILYIYVYMYVGSPALAYMWICGDINTHITYMSVYIYVCVKYICMCMHICYIYVHI